MKKIFLVLALMTNAFGQTQEHAQDIASNKAGSNKFALIKRVFGFKTPNNLVESVKQYDLVKAKEFAHGFKDLNEKQQKEVLNNLNAIEKVLKSNLSISTLKSWKNLGNVINIFKFSFRAPVIAALGLGTVVAYGEIELLIEMIQSRSLDFIVWFGIAHAITYNTLPYATKNIKLVFNIEQKIKELAEIKNIIDSQRSIVS